VPSEHHQTVLETRRSGNDVAAGPVEATGGRLVSGIRVAIDNEFVRAAHSRARLAPHRIVGAAAVGGVQRRPSPRIRPCVLDNQRHHGVEKALVQHCLPSRIVGIGWDSEDVAISNTPA